MHIIFSVVFKMLVQVADFCNVDFAEGAIFIKAASTAGLPADDKCASSVRRAIRAPLYIGPLRVVMGEADFVTG